MIKQISIYFYTNILPVLVSPWFWLCASCIAAIYKIHIPLWLAMLTLCECFCSLIDNCELFRGLGLESEYVTRFICNPDNPIDQVLRRQATYKFLKKTAEMLGYPNCLIKFESEKKYGDFIYTTWIIPNRNVYDALDMFFLEATKLYDEE